jgi:hypothetical protein
MKIVCRERDEFNTLFINNKEDFFIIGSVGLVWFMVFNTTFSYIVAISFIGGGNHRPVVSH